MTEKLIDHAVVDKLPTYIHGLEKDRKDLSDKLTGALSEIDELKRNNQELSEQFCASERERQELQEKSAEIFRIFANMKGVGHERHLRRGVQRRLR